MPAWLVFGESSLPGLEMAAFFLYLHVVKRKSASSLVSLLIEALIPLYQGPTLMTSFNPGRLPKSPSLNTMTLGFRSLAYKFKGKANIQTLTIGFDPHIKESDNIN